jgi:hypothetical protein
MPETRHARSGDVAIAYQVLGEGPFDVIFAPGSVSHVELLDEYAAIAPWDVSTQRTNEGFIRRTINPAPGHLEVWKDRGPSSTSSIYG